MSGSVVHYATRSRPPRFFTPPPMSCLLPWHLVLLSGTGQDLLLFSILFIPCRYIKLSSPNLNNVILLGGILMYITVFLYGFDGRLSPLSYTYVCRVSIVKLAEYRE